MRLESFKRVWKSFKRVCVFPIPLFNLVRSVCASFDPGLAVLCFFRILKARVQQRVECYEVQWRNRALNHVCPALFVTIETRQVLAVRASQSRSQALGTKLTPSQVKETGYESSCQANRTPRKKVEIWTRQLLQKDLVVDCIGIGAKTAWEKERVGKDDSPRTLPIPPGELMQATLFGKFSDLSCLVTINRRTTLLCFFLWSVSCSLQKIKELFPALVEEFDLMRAAKTSKTGGNSEKTAQNRWEFRENCPKQVGIPRKLPCKYCDQQSSNVMTSRKLFFWNNQMAFAQLFRTTYMRKVHI